MHSPLIWQLSISHTWLQKLVREFNADPSQNVAAAGSDPKFTELSRAREYTAEMKQRGELRLSRSEKLIQWLLP
jgi:hypothetical protein